ncbi:MAG: cell division protein FtsL [bacterium]
MIGAIRKFSETVAMQSSIFNRIRSNKYFPFAILGLFILSAACIHIWQRVQVLDLLHQVSLLNSENKELINDLRKVNSDIATLSKVSRIEQYAADSLGLKKVEAEKLFTLVRPREEQPELDNIAMVVTAIERVAAYLPTVSETQATAGELKQVIKDSLSRGGEN